MVKAPPVLTMDLKLGNLCNPKGSEEDFVYNDLNEFIGKESKAFLIKAVYRSEIQ